MAIEASELQFDKLLEKPFGFMATMNLLEMIKDEILGKAVIPLEATLDMDPVSGAILAMVTNPAGAKVIDLASIARADRLAIDADKAAEVAVADRNLLRMGFII